MKRLRTFVLAMATALVACNGIDCQANPGPGPGPVVVVPSSSTTAPGSSSTPDAGPVKPDKIVWRDYEMGAHLSETTGRPALIFFTTSWCPYCRKVDENVWTDPEIIETVAEDYIPVRVDLDEHPELGKRHNVKAVPRIIVYDFRDGEEDLRISGWYDDIDVYRDALD